MSAPPPGGAPTAWVGSPDDAGSGAPTLRRVRLGPGGPELLGPAQDVGPDPTYLARDEGGSLPDVVVAVHERAEGALSAWVEAPGRLEPLGRPQRVPAGPCHVVVDAEAGLVHVAAYAAGAISTSPLGPEGLGPVASQVRWTPPGPSRGDRRAASHAHQVVLDRRRHRLLVPDLGADLLRVLRVTGRDRVLEDLGAVEVHRGAGPRHLVVDGDWAYCLNELDATLSAVDLLGGREVHRVATTAAGGVPAHPSAVRLLAPGHLVLATRGPDTASLVRVAGPDMEVLDEVGCGGEHPRDLVATADGATVLVAGRASGTVSALRVDLAAGTLTPLPDVAGVPSPACLLPCGDAAAGADGPAPPQEGGSS